MKRLAALFVCIAACSLSILPAFGQEADLKPIPAQEAEKRVAEARDSLTSRLWLGLDLYWHTGEHDECVRLLREIIFIDPHFVDAYTAAAWSLWSRDKDDEAIALYEQGIQANPDSPEIYFDYGFYCRNRKKYEQAIALLHKANEKGVNQGKQHLLPNTLEEAGRKQEALDEWRALLKRFPTDAVAKMKIARLEQELKKQ